MPTGLKLLRCVALWLAAMLFWQAPMAFAQEGGFRSKAIRVVIGFVPGGAYDGYGRIVARHLGAHLPGHPAVVPENMPGAGGLIGENYLYNVAPRDGSVVGIVSQTAALTQLLGSTPGIKYDAQKFNWLGRIDSNIEVEYSWSASGIATLDDAIKREVLVAGTGPTSNSVIFPRLMNAILGTRFKVVTGYEGVQAASLALERGEIDGMTRIWSAIRSASANWIRDGRIHLLVQFSTEHHPDLPTVPTVVERAPTDEARQIFALYASVGDIGASLVAPPGLAPAVVEALRRAFDETLADPALQEEARAANMELAPLSGAELQTMVGKTFAIPPAVVAKAKALGGF